MKCRHCGFCIVECDPDLVERGVRYCHNAPHYSIRCIDYKRSLREWFRLATVAESV